MKTRTRRQLVHSYPNRYCRPERQHNVISTALVSGVLTLLLVVLVSQAVMFFASEPDEAFSLGVGRSQVAAE